MLALESDAGRVSVSWNRLTDGTMIRAHLVPAMRRVGLQMERVIKQRVWNDLLKVRRGNLHRSIFHRVEETPDAVTVRSGADLTKAPYGRVQDQGGTIKPIRAKFLTIPVGPNLTPNGVMRVNAREFISNPGSLGFTGSYVNRAKTAILGTKKGVVPVPVFALATSVTIRPTGYVTGSLDITTPYAMDQISGALAASLAEAASGAA